MSDDLADRIKERGDWLVDAVAASTQNRAFLRGDPECDDVACDAIRMNGEMAMRQIAKPLADRIEELETDVARLRVLVPRPGQTQDELAWRDHMRGVPLAALAKEFGCTKERMRYRLKKIAENKLHLTGCNDG